MASGLSIQHRRLLAWVAALGSAGLAAAVALAGPVTAANDDVTQQAPSDIGYDLPDGWTDESPLQPQFVAHQAPMCFYQDGDVGQCNVQILTVGSDEPVLDEEVRGLVGPCMPGRAAPTVSTLAQDTRELAGHEAEYARWAATCPSGDTLGIQAHHLKDLGVVVWSRVDSVYGTPVDNAGVEQILSSLTFE